jgi:hypothetical protein
MKLLMLLAAILLAPTLAAQTDREREQELRELELRLERQRKRERDDAFVDALILENERKPREVVIVECRPWSYRCPRKTR